ncbi:hypothetical protein HDV00_001871 [Rhizophlyctis rosea]|nr:hypothetical protein HDV00_001871 [Rhizophlyctis rosea]
MAVPDYKSFEDNMSPDQTFSTEALAHFSAVSFGTEIIRVGDVIRVKAPGFPELHVLKITAIIEMEGSIKFVGALWTRQTQFCFEYEKYETKMNAWVPMNPSTKRHIIDIEEVAGRYYPILSPTIFYKDEHSPLYPPRSYWYDWVLLDQAGRDMVTMPVDLARKIDRFGDPHFGEKYRDDSDVVQVVKGVRIRHDDVPEFQLVHRRKAMSTPSTSTSRKRLAIESGRGGETAKQRGKKKKKRRVESLQDALQDRGGSTSTMNRAMTEKEMNRALGLDSDEELSEVSPQNSSEEEEEIASGRVQRIVELPDEPDLGAQIGTVAASSLSAYSNALLRAWQQDVHPDDPTGLTGQEPAVLTTVVNNMLRHRHGVMFANPVDPIADHAPDYDVVVKNPMDLGTIQSKLGARPLESVYKSVEELLEDVKLMFENCFLYNMTTNTFHVIGRELEAFWHQQVQTIVDPVRRQVPKRGMIENGVGGHPGVQEPPQDAMDGVDRVSPDAIVIAALFNWAHVM